MKATVDHRDDIRKTAEEDRAEESAVLQHVLALHPTAITVEELAREIDPDRDSFSRRDAVERAVRDLAGAGLLHRSDSLVLPTRAALRFDQLLG
jgi:elongation factor P hydroxylase